MPDFDVIGTALAARFAPAQVTPPAGLTNVRAALLDLPPKITDVPTVLVMPDAGAVRVNAAGTRTMSSTWLVRFYFGLSRNIARETNGCRKWLTVLVDQLRTGMMLGGAPVTGARVMSWRIGRMEYGGQAFTGIELTVDVETAEAWTPTA